MNTNQKTPTKKIFIPIIDNGSGSVKANWAFCLIPALNGLSVQLNRVSDSHANRAMNTAAANFLASDATHFFVVDCDIIFSRQDVENLLSHDEPIVNGIYPKKEDATTPCLQTFEEGPRPHSENLLQVRRCGRGFMLVTREVFEAMKEDNGGPALRFHNHGRVEWDFFPSGPLTGGEPMSSFNKETDNSGFPVREWQSEDWWFFERAAQLGFKCLVDPRICLGHEGDKVFRFSGAQVGPVVKSWRDIHGWFDYEDLYRRIVGDIPDGGTFIEVGSWMGKSIAAFDEFAKEAGKGIHIHAVDTFRGEPANPHQAAILKDYGGSVEGKFRENMKALGVRVSVHAKSSLEVAAYAQGGTLDAVFIDAAHDYDSVKADIDAWYPKVKPGGILAGHDYDEAGVHQAVNDTLGEVKTMGRCWYIVKP